MVAKTGIKPDVAFISKMEGCRAKRSSISDAQSGREHISPDIDKDGTQRYTFLVTTHMFTYFVKNHTDSNMKYIEGDVVNMVNFLIDNIFVMFGGQVCRQTVGIPMGTNCAPLLADLDLCSYEASFIQDLLKRGQKKIAKSFNFTFRYIDDVLSLNNKSLVIIYRTFIQMSLKLRTELILLHQLHTLTFY
jgi:hypothetical protein